MSTYFRYDGTVRTVPGFAVAGANVAVLTQPAVTTTQPGSPLATLFAAGTSNSASASSASYNGGLIVFVFSATPPSDVVTGSFISVSGITPSGYNGVWQVVTVSGVNVTVATPYTFTAPNPGTYVSGTGTVATSSLPNPLQSDGNGQYFFYASPTQYTVQIYGGNLPINQQVYADQSIVSPGAGTVTSVALTMPTELTVTGSPVTTAGTLAVSKASQSANLIYAGPGSGASAPPTFRALVAADITGLGAGSVSSVALAVSVPSYLTSVITNSPVTTTGTLTATITANNQSANTVLAGPSSGGSGATSFRALVAADLPVSPVFTTVTLPAALMATLKVNVTSAQLKALPGSPLSLLTAPGASQLIRIHNYIYQYRYGTTAYTIANSDNTLALVYHGETGPIGTTALPATGLVDQTVNTLATSGGQFANTAQTACINLGVDLTLLGTTPGLTLGDGTLEILIEYSTLDLS